jgi:hypothetical protein
MRHPQNLFFDLKFSQVGGVPARKKRVRPQPAFVKA